MTQACSIGRARGSLALGGGRSGVMGGIRAACSAWSHATELRTYAIVRWCCWVLPAPCCDPSSSP